MKKFILIALLVIFLQPVSFIHADSVTDNALNFLKSKQNEEGRITTGFSAPSQWSAIAFAINEIDVSTIKNPDNSLMDFLLTDIPAEPSAATDWENRILAIVALGEDPTDFGGVNYVQKLENFYESSQIGDTCSINDDVFGLLALIAAGETSTLQIKQDSLDFLIQNQDPDDKGFGFSAPGCAWYATSADMTAAAVQALQEAKDNGLTSAGLDDAITKAKDYLLANQSSDGGFGYFGSSDADTTGWVLMAFNVLGLKDSTEAVNAKNWLLTQQSVDDGGFQAFDWGLGALVSNSTTTAQALIALSGQDWIIDVFTPPATPSATPSATSSPTPSPTPAPTPSPTPTSSPSTNNDPSPTPSPTPTLTTTPTPTPLPKLQVNDDYILSTPTPLPEVLGETITEDKQETKPAPTLVDGFKAAALPVAGVFGLFTAFRFIEMRWKR